MGLGPATRQVPTVVTLSVRPPISLHVCQTQTLLLAITFYYKR